jgi:uncharacterized protein YaiL (DUF2058 family)
MANSLRDELLKAGLVTEQQVRNADERRRRPPPRPASTKRSRPDNRQNTRTQPTHRPPISQRRQELDTREAERRKQEEERKAKEQERKARKVARAKVRTLLSRERQNDPKAEVSHKFLIGNQIKGVYVTTDQHRLLSSGDLAIVYFEKRAHLIAQDVAEKIRAISPSTFIHIGVEEARKDEDDTYAGYEVPDDLIW